MIAPFLCPICDFPYRAFLCLRFSMEADMCDLTNQEAYDYYQEVTESCAKDYWLQFLKDRANRGVVEAQGFVDKIEFCN